MPRARICKCLWSLGIDSDESIPPAYVAWRVVVTASQAGNQFLGSLTPVRMALWAKEFIIKMEGNTAEFSDISGSEIH